jgi:hypothetical protein
MNAITTYHYPNRMGRIILLSMEEVMGRNGVNALLKLASLPSLIENYPTDTAEPAFAFSTISNLTEMLEQAYGVRQYSTQLGLTQMAFRLLPLPSKLHAGASAFAELFNNFTDQRVRVEEEDGTILWHIERCPLCWERKAQDPVCHLAVGLLQEALYWLSGGKVFNVEEKTCIAAGDQTCTIVIDQSPLF